MLPIGAARKVTIYVNEDSKTHGRPLHMAVMDLLLRSGVAGGTAYRAMAGFGSHHKLHTPGMEVLAEHLPVRVEFIETPERVDALLPALRELVTDGLIDVQETTVVVSACK